MPLPEGQANGFNVSDSKSSDSNPSDLKPSDFKPSDFNPSDALLLPLEASLREQTRPFGVALSGGADSAMLAVVANAYAHKHGTELHFFHIHHGLLEQADAWVEQVQALASLLDRPLHVINVNVAVGEGKGIEAAARDARYAALTQAAQAAGVTRIGLAHHRDDQAETVLLRLLRGAGVSGLSAMKREITRDGIAFIRPWLDVDRAAILAASDAFTTATGWQAVQDPTNSDPRYTRAAVRTALTPVLNARWPGWQAIVARHAKQADEATEILAELAHADLVLIADEEAAVGTASEEAFKPHRLDLKRWRDLSAGRQKNVLRYWLAMHGSAMPSEARLLNLQRQLSQLHAMGHDRNLTIYHGVLRIQCIRGKILVQKISPR